MALDGAEGLQFILTDHLGSVVAVADPNGALVADSQQRYLPFGQPRLAADSPTDFTFTGQRELDAVGLMDYNARWYDAALGRFTQPDTIVPSFANPQALNRYAYVNNNPINNTDPSGHCYRNSEKAELRKCVNKRFGVDLSDGGEKVWTLANMKRVYMNLRKINQMFRGQLKGLIQGSVFEMVYTSRRLMIQLPALTSQQKDTADGRAGKQSPFTRLEVKPYGK